MKIDIYKMGDMGWEGTYLATKAKNSGLLALHKTLIQKTILLIKMVALYNPNYVRK